MKWWDVKNTPVYTDETPEAYQIRRWLSQVFHGGVVNDKAVLICYNRKCPELTYLLVEGI